MLTAGMNPAARPPLLWDGRTPSSLDCSGTPPGSLKQAQRTYRRVPPMRYKGGDAHERPARPVPAPRPRMVSHRTRRTDAAAAAGLAAHRRRTEHAHPRADRLRQDAGRLPRLPRPPLAAGIGGPRRARPLRLAAEGAQQRHPSQPASAARRRRGDGPPHGLPAARARGRRPHRRHAGRRAAAADPPAAARPHHHARIAASAADLPRPRHAARRHALHRR